MEELCASQPLPQQVLREDGEQKRQLVPEGLSVGSQSSQGGENAGWAEQVASQGPRHSSQKHGEARYKFP